MFKGVRFNDPLQNPLTGEADAENVQFLHKFLEWVDRWDEVKQKPYCLSPETQWALGHTTHGLLEMMRHCIEELSFKYFLPGKIQTDALEERFGKYRCYAGSHYLVTVRQIFEVEAKIRLQNFLPLQSSCYGTISINIESNVADAEIILEGLGLDADMPSGSSGGITVDPPQLEDLEKLQDTLPAIVYMCGYCTRVVIRKLKCESCGSFLVMNKEEVREHKENSLVKSMDRGGLIFPHIDLINAVICNYYVVQKLIEGEREKEFLSHTNQKALAFNLTVDVVKKMGFFLERDFVCPKKHTKEEVLKYLLLASTNTLLNDYVKKRNDVEIHPRKKRKSQTFN